MAWSLFLMTWGQVWLARNETDPTPSDGPCKRLFSDFGQRRLVLGLGHLLHQPTASRSAASRQHGAPTQVATRASRNANSDRSHQDGFGGGWTYW